jgi:hypothetical protein
MAASMSWGMVARSAGLMIRSTMSALAPCFTNSAFMVPPKIAAPAA